MKITSTNPSNNYQVIGEVEFSTPQEVKDKVSAAHNASKMWRELGVAKRSELVRELADLFDKERTRIIELTAKEMGMPLKELDEDVDFSLEYLRSYCDLAEKSLKSFITTEDEKEIHEVFREPYGVAVCIVPWNFPLANFVWQCGQNLVAGNTVVFKHSEETQLCGQLIEELVNQILPEGVFNEVYGDGSVGEVLVNEDVDLICFTGSSKTGAKINESAARRFIPTVMELGGSAPGIVFDSTNVKDVIETIYTARFMNCGQMCDGLKRLIVHESKFDEVVEQLSK
ncbi:MAG: Aldedh protein, partial [Patescibacteria group bacterium]|nr:Aldedh protein [Patescibacteria group bacterium]